MGKKVIVSYNKLVDKVTALCPNAEFEEDDDGQIIIKTNLVMFGDEDDPMKLIFGEDGDEDDEDEEDEEDEDEDEDG